MQASLRERLSAVREGGAVPPELLDVRVERVSLDDGDPVHVVRPADWAKLREAEKEAGHDTPYWAVPWPSGNALARFVAATGVGRGTRVLELGCGLGLPSLAAARAGARVVASDGSADAAIFAAHNLALNEVEGDVLPADWRDAADELARDPFPLVLAADVLYLRENVESLLRVLPRLIAPDGEAWIADPGRAGTEEFLPAARRIWDITRQRDERDDRVTLYRLRPLRR